MISLNQMSVVKNSYLNIFHGTMSRQGHECVEDLQRNIVGV